MKEIPLNIVRRKRMGCQGLFALVDDSDYEDLSKHRWSTCKSKHTIYVKAIINGQRQLMHRYILGLRLNVDTLIEVDHKDGNGLNNQRSNIRACSKSENQRNRKACGVSKYLGVAWWVKKTTYFRKKTQDYRTSTSSAWLASIKVANKKKHLELFKTEEAAALAYNDAAAKYHGEFARLNVIQN